MTTIILRELRTAAQVTFSSIHRISSQYIVRSYEIESLVGGNCVSDSFVHIKNQSAIASQLVGVCDLSSAID